MDIQPNFFQSKSPIPLFWWSERKFIFKDKENYGDLLAKYLVEKISGKKVEWVHPKKQPWYKFHKLNYLTIGSIIHHASKDSIVWGSGIIDNIQPVGKADFKAVRGPQTRKFLMARGYDCPKIFGDPALLLPKYFYPEVAKEYKIGIIPHYNDYKEVAEDYKKESDIIVIDLMTMEVEDVTRQIMACKKIISSSLHGIIVSHAYNIPALWVKFSDKIFGDGIKYRDYLESVSIPFYESPFLENKLNLLEIESFFQHYPVLPEKGKIEELVKGLIDCCPFTRIYKKIRANQVGSTENQV